MKTIYLYDIKYYNEGMDALQQGHTCFVIGVKTGDSLEWLQGRYPNLVIERLPEVANMNYLAVDNVMELHMLQPAFLTWKEPAVVHAPVAKTTLPVGSVHAPQPRKPF